MRISDALKWIVLVVIALVFCLLMVRSSNTPPADPPVRAITRASGASKSRVHEGALVRLEVPLEYRVIHHYPGGGPDTTYTDHVLVWDWGVEVARRRWLTGSVRVDHRSGGWAE